VIGRSGQAHEVTGQSEAMMIGYCVDFWKELPKSSTGKILKKEMRKRYKA
jgi:hypothetical protein